MLSRGVAVVKGESAVCGKSFAAVKIPVFFFGLALDFGFGLRIPDGCKPKNQIRFRHRREVLATHGTHALYNCQALGYYNGAHARASAMAIGALRAEY